MTLSLPLRLMLLAAGLWLMVAPWPFEERSHLYGKLEWLWVNGGDHMRPVDIFDLFFHAGWGIVAGWALFTWFHGRRAPAAATPPG